MLPLTMHWLYGGATNIFSYVKVFAAWAEKFYIERLTLSCQVLSALIFLSQAVNLLLAVGVAAAIFYQSLESNNIRLQTQLSSMLQLQNILSSPYTCL